MLAGVGAVPVEELVEVLRGVRAAKEAVQAQVGLVGERMRLPGLTMRGRSGCSTVSDRWG
jgi:hypothetical protein